jgi:dual specificity tyrosine-phosphorylation-regulated kinase 2/3/4
LKYSMSISATRRASTLVPSESANVSPTNYAASEFGVMESEDGATPKVKQPFVRVSPSTSSSRVPQSSVTAPTTSSAQRRTNRLHFNYWAA